METMKLRAAFWIWLLAIIITGCKQETLNKPTITNNNAPGVVTNVQVQNQNGKASLTYSLPGDNDLFYVKAVYETSPGKTREVIASRYTNTLTVDGFGDTLAHVIKLYAVNSSEKVSAPVSVTANPLTPPYLLAYRSLKITPTFGGFNIACDNISQDNLVIVPMVDTANNGLYIQTKGMDNVYSSSISIKAAVRGQPAIERKYAFFVRDRFLNKSDTLFLKLTPFYEEQFSKSDWSTYVLPGDATNLYSYTDVTKIFDGNFTGGWPNCLFTVESAGSPQMVTIDLGKQRVFSRFILNPFIEIGNVYYVRGNLRDFEIWGSNSPNVNGALDASWTKLLTCNIVKPSGSPSGTETAADYKYAHDGWGFDFPAGLSAYRYIRIRSLRNWTGSYFMSISEFTMFGK
ncbi:DUF5000 domain-containing lipoprotein [Mucilaginibacter sp. cycad4]|uniref:DUF5000 domain-containing lipoprotein n=1 Tax=Mucilaginibacter sp. cycad4 TaxID=3342096 RepID=UPI002AAAFF3C|nr:DUF5000 domain-containing lipoprotein [Mucilaginibacter gossypii]WPV01717.1 DUF5000 domain-containing lipoprotein [Mucilaginibacter gossypii]